MKCFTRQPRIRTRSGFTLVIALMLLAVMVLVVVGLFGSSISTQVAGVNDQHMERARAATRSGLASVQSLLEHATWNDDYVVLTHDLHPEALDERQRCPVLMIARPDLGADAVQDVPCKSTVWHYQPLVSGADMMTSDGPGPLASPSALPYVIKTDAVTGQPLTEAVGLPRTLPWQPPVDSHWQVVYDSQTGEAVSRFCFWVEDMQSYLDMTKTGNYGDALNDSSGMMERVHEREKPKVLSNLAQVQSPRDWYVGLAPGLRTPDDDETTDDRRWAMTQAALFSVYSPTLADDVTSEQADNALMHARWMPLRGSSDHHASLLAGPEDWRAALIHLQTTQDWRAWLKRNPYDVAKTDAIGGRLVTPAARMIEENTIIGTQPYLEYNVIPSDYGVFAHPREPKLNLNRVLEQLARRQITRLAAVNLIADHIERHLPLPTTISIPTTTMSATERFGFAQRSGAYPFPRRTSMTTQTAASCRAYLQNLAASLLDYADADCVPTLKEDGQPGTDVAWRGMDSAPVVSEHYVRYRLESFSAGQASFSVTFYNELWNMSTRPVTGTYQQEYVSKASVNGTYTDDKKVTFKSSSHSIDLSNANAYSALTQASQVELVSEVTSSGTSYWMPLYESDGQGGVSTPVSAITLQPNEYRVLATRDFTFNFAIGTPSNTANYSTIQVSEDTASYYRIRFDPSPLVQTPDLFGAAPEDKTDMDNHLVVAPATAAASKPYAIIDRCVAVQRNDTNLGMQTSDNVERQQMRGTAPGNGTNFAAGKVYTNGDPRVGFYMVAPLVDFSYALNSSLWGPTIRRDINSKRINYATYLSRWPDKGHDLSLQMGITAGDQKSEPFHKDIVAKRPVVEPWQSTLAPMRISNAGRYFSVTELGNIHDPLFWDPNGNTANDEDDADGDLSPWKAFWDLGTKADGVTVESSVAPNSLLSGGNTLRIGRPEHRLFRSKALGGQREFRGLCATALLDLFHCGVSTVGATTAVAGTGTTDSQAAQNLRDLTGPLSEINGHVNINTAKPSVLRALVAGTMVADPASQTSGGGTPPSLRAPMLSGPAISSTEADKLVDEIIRGRPYISTAAVAERVAENPSSGSSAVPEPVFGVDTKHAGWNAATSEWNDAAAEEIFARLYNATTVRSRNFRVFVTGQAIRQRRSDSTKIDVLATRHRCYQVHVHPIRDPSTGLIERQRVEVTYEQDL